MIQASGATKGGSVTVAGKDKVSASGARIRVKGGTTGGEATITAPEISLAGTRIDASGWEGGGRVRVGGDKQGEGTLARARTVSVDGKTRLAADAGVRGDGGTIIVWSDEHTAFAGQIRARGGEGGDGGFAEVSSKGLLDYRGFANRTAGRGAFGTLLLDPYNITISNAANSGMNGFAANGNDSVLNVATLQAALAGANVTVTTGKAGSPGTQAGDITVANAITWSAPTTLTLSAYRNIAVNAAITNPGVGAGLVLRADNSGTGSGNVTFGAGGSANLASGTVQVIYNPLSYTSPTNYASKISAATPEALMLVNNVNQLQAIETNPSAGYALGRDIDASATAGWNGGAGFNPIGKDGDGTEYFTGKFDGLGHTITGLTINRPGADYVGLFGVAVNARIRDVGLIGGSVTGNFAVGMLVGTNFGDVSGSFATGTVSGAQAVGGLVGSNNFNLTRSYATGTVTGADSVGGLVGDNTGTVTQSYAGGGAIGGTNVGGLVGYNAGGTLERVYAIGVATGSGNVGGLVGLNEGTVSQAHASGAVLSAGTAGGLVGTNAGSVSSSFWDTQTTGRSASAGANFGTVSATGLTTAQARQQASYVGWSFANDWYMVEGQTRPFLRSEYSTTIRNTHQLQLMNLDTAANYTLRNSIDAGATSGANPSDMWTTSGFVPISTFTGSLDGDVFAIGNLSIDRPGTGNVGLFSAIGGGGSVSDLKLTAGSVTGGNFTGLLAGSNAGTITRTTVAGIVTGNNAVGGLVGSNGGTVAETFAKVAVVGGTEVGGLVGMNAGTVNQTYATGAVSGSSEIGGLVGSNTASLTQSYATGAVTGSSDVGGLAGTNSGTIAETYSIGAVSGGSDTGGLLGSNSGTITLSYWDTDTTLQATSAGSPNAAGFATAQMTDLTTLGSVYAGWSFTNIWSPPNQAGQGGDATAHYPELYSLSRVIWVDPESKTRTYGDANPTLTVGTYGLRLGDALIQTPTASTVATQTSDAGSYAITASPAAATSLSGEPYRFIYSTGTLTVDPATLTVAADAKSKTYGALDPALSYAVSGFKLSDTAGLLSGDLGRAAGENVGTYAIGQGTLSAGPNYTIAYTGQNLAITPAALTITASDRTKTYGDTLPLGSAAFTAAGLQNAETIGSVTLTSAGADASANAGLYTIGASSAGGGTFDSGNYAITYVNGSLSVDKAVLTVAAEAKSKIYGEADPALTYAASGFKLSDSSALLTGDLTRAAGENVGAYGIDLGGLSAGSNYTIAYTGQDLTVTPRALTVTADAKTMVVGSPVPFFTYVVGGLGLVNGDTVSGSLDAGVNQTSPAGSYAIGQGTLSAGDNYDLTYVGNTLEITAAPVIPDPPVVQPKPPTPPPVVVPLPPVDPLGEISTSEVCPELKFLAPCRNVQPALDGGDKLDFAEPDAVARRDGLERGVNLRAGFLQRRSSVGSSVLP